MKVENENFLTIKTDDLSDNETKQKSVVREYYKRLGWKDEGVVIYTRVSSSQNKNNLEGQAKRVEEYCIAKGYKINGIIKEIGSGLNDGRKQLANLLEKGKCGKIVVEHKDRLTRFGFKYIEMLCKEKRIEVEIINEVDTDRDSLMQDFVSLVTSFCSRLYGQRRNKRKTEQLIEALKNNSEDKK